MKILLIESHNFGKEDIRDTFMAMGHQVILFEYPDFLTYEISCNLLQLDKTINSEKPDLVFSSNFSPNVSAVCHSHSVPYVSWVYDSPLLAMYSASLANSNNYVFMFDSEEYNTFKNSGINTVYYLPLAANSARMDSMIPTELHHERLDADVSFVGRLYDEDTDNFANASNMNDYAKGYLDAMMEAQKLVNGYSFTEVLTKGIFLEELERTVPYSPHTGNAATKEYVYSRYFIDKKITSEERKSIIKRVSDSFNTKLYTVNPTPYLPNAINMGSVNAYSQLPYVFKCSKINLNISLRSIHAGIPLRAIEIMGAGGFLLSNFQRDFLDYFEPDKDFVYYEDENDLIDKCRFYLDNDNERLAIANNGYLKVKEFFSYDVMLKKILETLFS